jgi:hypothetical protein
VLSTSHTCDSPQCSIYQWQGFFGVISSSVSIENGNKTFVLLEDLVIDIVDRKLIRSFSKSREIAIPSDIAIVGPMCFFSFV